MFLFNSLQNSFHHIATVTLMTLNCRNCINVNFRNLVLQDFRFLYDVIFPKSAETKLPLTRYMHEYGRHPIAIHEYFT